MSFSLVPPEVNSALMYSGAGSGPLLEAGSAWDSLAADLEATATQYQTVITNLTTGPWLGSASARMASATAPYIAWLQGTAATAAQTGAQAKVAAAAYQSAYASIVPPAEIAANRAELAELVANNFLGQNTGAIATNEAEYLDMWIQDALTMDTYQMNSQQAAALPQQTPAPQVANGTVANAAAAAQPAQGISSLPTDLEALAEAYLSSQGLDGAWTSVLSDAGLPTLLSDVGLPSSLDTALATGLATPLTSASLLPVQEAYYGLMGASMPARMFMSMGSSSSASSAGASLANSSDALLENVGKFVDGKLATVMGGVGNQLASWGHAVSASLASAHHVGGLSIPNAWHGMAPEMSRAAPVLPATSVAAPTMSTGLPSSPFAQGLMGALAGRGMSSLGSRVAAKVMPRSPVGG
jgi:PPE-repeat protein